MRDHKLAEEAVSLLRELLEIPTVNGGRMRGRLRSIWMPILSGMESTAG